MIPVDENKFKDEHEYISKIESEKYLYNSKSNKFKEDLKKCELTNFNLLYWLENPKNKEIVKHRFLWILFGITELKSGNSYYLEKIKNSFSTEKNIIFLSFQHLVAGDPILAVWVSNEPEKILKIFEGVCNEIISDFFPVFPGKSNRCCIKISGFPVYEDLAELRKIKINSLVKIKGIVISKTDLSPNLSFFKLICMICSEIQKDTFSNLNDQKKIFILCFNCKSKGPFSVYWCKNINKKFQKIFIQELPSQTLTEKIPFSIEVLLKERFVNCVKIGEEIEVTGILKYNLNIENVSNFSLPLFSMFIDANNLEKSNKAFNLLNFSKLDEIKIRKFSQKSNLLLSFITFFCPSIYGQFDAKLALILCIFGNKDGQINKNLNIRKNINILITGDSKTGKTTMLKFIDNLGFKSYYISGEGVTLKGLSFSNFENFKNNGLLGENGIMALADKGFCIIDGLEKINSQERILFGEIFQNGHLVNENYKTMNKKNHLFSLTASINPKSNFYQKNLSLKENIEIDEKFINYFDLVCIMKDKSDISLDEKVGYSVLNSNFYYHPNFSEKKLGKMINFEKKKKLIDPDFFMKYSFFALKNLRPNLKDINHELISNLYVSFRKESVFEGGIKISLLNLESIFRLIESSARLHLREFANAEDFSVGLFTFIHSFVKIQPVSISKVLKLKYRFLILYLIKKISEKNQNWKTYFHL